MQSIHDEGKLGLSCAEKRYDQKALNKQFLGETNWFKVDIPFLVNLSTIFNQGKWNSNLLHSYIF